jgi:hypothetical protein
LTLHNIRQPAQVPLRDKEKKKREGKTKIEYITSNLERSNTLSQRRKTLFNKVNILKYFRLAFSLE